MRILNNMSDPCDARAKSLVYIMIMWTVRDQSSLDLFYYLFMCVYMCLYVINYLFVYFGLGLVKFGVRRVLQSFQTQGYFGHFVSKVKLVISWRELFLVFQVKTIIFTKLLFGSDNQFWTGNYSITSNRQWIETFGVSL